MTPQLRVGHVSTLDVLFMLGVVDVVVLVVKTILSLETHHTRTTSYYRLRHRAQRGVHRRVLSRYMRETNLHSNVLYR